MQHWIYGGWIYEGWPRWLDSGKGFPVKICGMTVHMFQYFWRTTNILWMNGGSLNPILARLPELHRWPGNGRFARPVVNCQKFVQTSAKPIFFSLHFYNLLANLRIVTEPFWKIYYISWRNSIFRFGRADLPFPGQDRVKRTT